MNATPDYSGLPTIRLAGKDYPVKPLVVKQLRVVVPAMMRLRGARLETITQEQFDDLVEMAYMAVCPCQTGLTRDEFTDLPIKAIELMEAIPVIAAQSGMLKEKSEPGEAQAGTRQTGN
jgi:hypothetical protein